MYKKNFQDEASGLLFGTILGATMALGGLRALLGAKWAPGASPGGSQNAPGGPRGRKKFIAIFRGSEISHSQGVLVAHVGPPSGDWC